MEKKLMVKNIYIPIHNRAFWGFQLILFALCPLFSQKSSPAEEEGMDVTEEIPEVSDIKLTPVFPDTEEGLIYIEGEDAVSTNFATSPVYNYGASSYSSLQLIQQNSPYGGQSYYAEYAFYVKDPGEYSFWYGGTPSGPKEDIYPSYASPFRYFLDNKEPVEVYRENQSVVQAYTPSYYWNEIGNISLEEGVHTLRFEVSEKRRFDGQFYFFLDAFFFLKTERMEEELTLVPPVFPLERTDRSIDNPFQSIAYYENIIKENPGNKNAYIVLSMVYSLLGDYINAIRNLNSAINLDSEDPYPLLLMAKNRIWNGEVTAGLNLYRQLVALAPDNPVYWAEAGKVAAWTGKYRDSIDFFTKGLEVFPDDLNLMVNLGLTYLWMSRSEEAENMFQEAMEGIEGDHDRIMDLGQIHELSGYPENAVEIYAQEISRSPEFLETYLALEKSYRNSGEREKAARVIELIYNSFEESPAFTSYMNVYEQQVQLKQTILDNYREELEKNPDNISLRQELAQTYFWNGLKEEAVDESLRILVNKMFLVFRNFDTQARDLLDMRDTLAYRSKEFADIDESYAKEMEQLESLFERYAKAGEARKKNPDDPALVSEVETLSFSLSEAFHRAEYRNRELETFKERLENLKSRWAVLSAEQTREEELFRQLLGDLDWSWDRDFTKAELQQVQRNEPFLSGYILGRLAMIEGRNATAVRYLDQEVFSDSPFARYSLYQSLLWMGEEEGRQDLWEEEADMLTLYNQNLFDLEASGVSREDSGEFYIPLKEDIERISEKASREEAEFDQYRTVLQNTHQDIQKSLDRKLNRQIYALEQDTYKLRYELGDYYLDMGENLKASLQYDRVLAMDPWNISANYKLGVVSQRYGNWYRAMQQYRKVYYQNPLYENAASYYNQLARSHADAIHITAQNITDPSRISHQGNADYHRNITDRLGWGFSYQMDVDSLYRTYGTEDPSSFKLQTLDLKLPVTISQWDLEVTPFGGFHLFNRFFGSRYDFNPFQPVSLEENRTATTFQPRGGVDLTWKQDFLTAQALYTYELEEDSLFEGRNLTTQHALDLSADTYFPMENKESLGPVTTRTFGSFKVLNSENALQGNQVYQIVQEASLGYSLSKKPSIRITGNGLFNYENSKETPVTDYYAPEDIFELKGGLRGTLGFHNASYTENLELSLYGSGGSYWAGRGDPSMKLEGQLSLYYVKDSMMLYLIAGTNGTFSEGLSEDPGYWEVSATLGCRLNMPSFLVP